MAAKIKVERQAHSGAHHFWVGHRRDRPTGMLGAHARQEPTDARGDIAKPLPVLAGGKQIRAWIAGQKRRQRLAGARPKINGLKIVLKPQRRVGRRGDRRSGEARRSQRAKIDASQTSSSQDLAELLGVSFAIGAEVQLVHPTGGHGLAKTA